MWLEISSEFMSAPLEKTSSLGDTNAADRLCSNSLLVILYVPSISFHAKRMLLRVTSAPYAPWFKLTAINVSLFLLLTLDADYARVNEMTFLMVS